MPLVDSQTTTSTSTTEAADLERFRRVQRLAYDAAVEVASELTLGITEKEAAARLGEACRARGVRRYFHKPFAWFGDRTKFAGFSSMSPRFFPSSRRLQEGAIVILDVAPIVENTTADIGYTIRFGGPDAAFDRALETLREVREKIPQWVTSGETMRSVYRKVDGIFEAAGYDNRHSRYPFGVLGHRLMRASPVPREPHFAGFGVSSALQLLGGELASRLRVTSSPMWSNDARSDRPPEPGLWSVEPHLGADDFGAKFEEILVVTPHRAYWLDHALPHVQRGGPETGETGTVLVS